MIQAFITLFRLSVLQGSPANLPYSLPLLGVFIVTSVSTVFLYPRHNITIGESLLAKILSIVILVGIIYWLLVRKNQASRLHKTLLAWFGTELIADALSLILFGMSTQQEPTIAIFPFLIWCLFVKSYILKQTFTLTLAKAFFLLLGILIPASLPLMIFIDPQLPG